MATYPRAMASESNGFFLNVSGWGCCICALFVIAVAGFAYYLGQRNKGGPTP